MKISFNNFNFIKQNSLNFRADLKDFPMPNTTNPLSQPSIDIFIRQEIDRSDKRREIDTEQYDTHLSKIDLTDVINDSEGKFTISKAERFKREVAAGRSYFSTFELAIPFFNNSLTFESFNERVMKKSMSKDGYELVRKTLDDTGIDTLEKFSIAYKSFVKLKKEDSLIVRNPLDFLRSYAMAQTPDDWENFADSLFAAESRLFLYEEETDIQGIISFLKSLGIKSDKEIPTIFSHLKEEHNGMVYPSAKLGAIIQIQETFDAKIEAMKIWQDFHPELEDVDLIEFYLKYAEIIDTLYENNQNNAVEVLGKFLSLKAHKEDLNPSTIRAMSTTTDSKSAQGQVEIYELLAQEDISIEEANKLTKLAYFEGQDLADILINRNEFVGYIASSLDIDTKEAQEFYLSYAQTINALALKDDKQMQKQIKKLALIFKTFDIKSDQDFANFYAKSNPAPSKGKKTNAKPTVKNIQTFVELLDFLDESLIEKQKKNKNFNLRAELATKKAKLAKNSNVVGFFDEKIKPEETEKPKTNDSITVKTAISSKELKPYLGKDKKVDLFLAHFEAMEKRGLTFNQYIEKIAQVQKRLDSFGIPIKLNNDTISNLTFEDLNSKMSLTRALEFAKSTLNPNDEGNFICGLNNSLTKAKRYSSKMQIGEEIFLSQNGRYGEEYSGVIKAFNLSINDLGFKNAGNSSYMETLAYEIPKELQKAINSKNLLPTLQDDKKPNMSLHARMRLIDRFCLQEGRPLDEKAIAELREILKVVYTKNPNRMIKSPMNDSSFQAFYNHNDYEIKAVFDKNGKMITIIKV